MGCDHRCYTKGKGCAISNSGKCAMIYDAQEKDYVRNFKSAAEKMLKEFEGNNKDKLSNAVDNVLKAYYKKIDEFNRSKS